MTSIERKQIKLRIMFNFKMAMIMTQLLFQALSSLKRLDRVDPFETLLEFHTHLGAPYRRISGRPSNTLRFEENEERVSLNSPILGQSQESQDTHPLHDMKVHGTNRIFETLKKQVKLAGFEMPCDS